MKYTGDIGKHTLFIDTWSSTCGNCGQGAKMEDKTHAKCYGYGEQPPGCNIEWKYVSSNYTEGVIAPDRLKSLVPHLQYVSLYDVIKGEVTIQ